MPLTSLAWTFAMDTRKLAESVILLASLLYAASHIAGYTPPSIPPFSYPEAHVWLALELRILSAVSSLYMLWVHSTFTFTSTTTNTTPTPTTSLKSHTSALSAPSVPLRPASPRLGDASRGGSGRQAAPTSYDKSDFGYVWMSVPKNYRDCRDDGILTGLLLGPLIATSVVAYTLLQFHSVSVSPSLSPTQTQTQTPIPTSILPQGWRIEPPLYLRNSRLRLAPAQAALLSRYGLVDLSTYCAVILLVHVCASWWVEARARARVRARVAAGAGTGVGANAGVGATGRTGGGGGGGVGVVDGERASVPRSEGLRSSWYILFALCTSVLMVSLKLALKVYDVKLWNYLNVFEAVVASLFYQFSLYVALRLAHRGFTLGELGLTCFGATAIGLEFLNLTIARIRPITTPYIRTYRLPTPLLTFQIALIVGSLLTGFLLSPFLVLSRNNAQRPVHRLRFPQEKARNRKLYAGGFYGGAVLCVGVLVGVWTRWCLGGRDPWVWVVYYVVERTGGGAEGEGVGGDGGKAGGRRARVGMVVYWAILGLLSVAGWNRQLARSRRFRMRNTTSVGVESMSGDSNALPASSSSLSSSMGMGMGGGTSVDVDGASNSLIAITPSSFPSSSSSSLPNGAGGAAGMMSNVASASGMMSNVASGMMSNVASGMMSNVASGMMSNVASGSGKMMSNVATDLLDAADKRVPTLGLNARRKFFHGLAVVMFVPGIAVDPAFTHLALSVAFALFTFVEYIRYFAIYPFGAAVHLFMNEFLDHRDSGTAILSHFYLLTGSAGSLWLEGPSRLLQFTGILTLGLGDAAASIVGRRIGVHRWSSTTSKTLEGSIAFVGSVVGAAGLLRLAGYVESFSSAGYLGVVCVSALLEAVSDQNDNLTLPLYMWSLLVVCGVA
ncbi:Dolichol kinase EVAN [Psilocybe cubensis]|nr:Dolichol kinase EVAN [Psilocybe cubensis]KAH9481646.1 Dolichol kinase EVAN [Psilocybe cubensis]